MHAWLETKPSRESPALRFQNVTISISADDPDEMLLETNGPDNVSPVSGLHVAIEYCAASGDVTRRRITMRRLTIDHDAIMLDAICHERRAHRRFRCDRIFSFVTRDGELHEPKAFWKSIGIDPDAIARSEGAYQEREVRSLLGPQTVLLAGIANCDGQVDRAEIDAIINYIEISFEKIGLLLTPTAVETLRNRIRRLRPDYDSLATAIDSLFVRRLGGQESLSKEQAKRFLRAAAEVVNADGILCNAEHAFLAELDAIVTK